MNITYHAANTSMGDTSAADCEKFRAWAQEQLEAEYPEHEITVSEEDSLSECITDDIDNEEEIADFCNRLWDRCPWDFE